jgi:DNA-binding LacI/PurR family transcriptional regulator
MAAGRPTLDTVAAEAGVSRMTVSNAYNRPDQLAAATRERVLAAAARVGYTGPDPTAASLRLRRTGTVGVVLTERLPYAFTDPGMVRILHGLASGLSEAGLSLLLVPESGSTGDPGAGSAVLLRQAMVDALVLCSLQADDPAVAAARDRGVPLVTVGSPWLRGVPTVGVDHRTSSALAAAHLQAQGHSRYAVLTAGPAPGVRTRPGFVDRPDGFVGALVGVDPASVLTCLARENSREAGAEAVGELLAMPAPSRPTALFAVTDILALGAIDAANAGGVSVPHELSVVGYDDIPEATTSTPPLTTVHQDLFEQGRIAARLAVRQIAGESVRAPRMSARLVVRASTAAPRADRGSKR